MDSFREHPFYSFSLLLSLQCPRTVLVAFVLSFCKHITVNKTNTTFGLRFLYFLQKKIHLLSHMYLYRIYLKYRLQFCFEDHFLPNCFFFLNTFLWKYTCLLYFILCLVKITRIKNILTLSNCGALNKSICLWNK